jgi:hypothetical protein
VALRGLGAVHAAKSSARTPSFKILNTSRTPPSW